MGHRTERSVPGAEPTSLSFTAFGPRPMGRPHKGGTAPTRESVERKCQQILHRQHLRQLVQTTVILNAAAVPQLSYQCDSPAQEKLRDTYLGKTLLITGHQEWSDVQVIRAYRISS